MAPFEALGMAEDFLDGRSKAECTQQGDVKDDL